MPSHVSTIHSLRAIKKSIRSALPQCRPAHLAEALAAGLGYRTYAALQADITTGPVQWCSPTELDVAAFAIRLSQLDGGTVALLGTDLMHGLSTSMKARIIPIGANAKAFSSSTEDTTYGEVAVQCLMSGWTVFPQDRKAFETAWLSDGTRPEWQHYIDQAPGRDVVEEWAIKAPNAYGAIILGSPSSNVFVLDIEVDEPEDIARFIALAHEKIGPTKFVQRRGKQHAMLFYRVPRASPNVRLQAVVFGTRSRVAVASRAHIVQCFGHDPTTGKELVWDAGNPTLRSANLVPLAAASELEAFFVAVRAIADRTRDEDAARARTPSNRINWSATEVVRWNKALQVHTGLYVVAGPSGSMREEFVEESAGLVRNRKHAVGGKVPNNQVLRSMLDLIDQADDPERFSLLGADILVVDGLHDQATLQLVLQACELGMTVLAMARAISIEQVLERLGETHIEALRIHLKGVCAQISVPSKYGRGRMAIRSAAAFDDPDQFDAVRRSIAESGTVPWRSIPEHVKLAFEADMIEHRTMERYAGRTTLG